MQLRMHFRNAALVAIIALVPLVFYGCGGSGGSGPLRQDISGATLQTLMADGQPTLLVDVRTAAEYAISHIPDTVNLPHVDVDTWAGQLNPTFRIVCICKVGGRSAIAADALVRKGFRDVYNLTGGMDQWEGEVEAFRQDISVQDLQDMLDAGGTMQLCDVRTPTEYDTGHIPGFVNLPHTEVDTWADTLVKQQTVICICKGGFRSGLASDALLAKGFHKVYNVLGGMDAWTGATE